MMTSLGDEVHGSKEWLEARRQTIGSSDAPSIHNASPYKNRHELWKWYLKLIPDQEMNEAMWLGTRFEDNARARLSLEVDEEYYPRKIIYGDWPVLVSNLDGYCYDSFCEIKYLGNKNFDACNDGKVDWLKANKFHYWIQMQHQFLCTGLDKAYFVFYALDNHNKNMTRWGYFLVKPDLEFIKKHIKECMHFWREVTEKIEPENVKLIRRR